MRPAVLKLPQFRLLFSGRAVSVIGDALFPVALAFAILDELDGTAGQLGLVLAAETLPLTTMLACGVTVIALFTAALAAGDVRRLTAP